jgi:hypothetical protein
MGLDALARKNARLRVHLTPENLRFRRESVRLTGENLHFLPENVDVPDENLHAPAESFCAPWENVRGTRGNVHASSENGYFHRMSKQVAFNLTVL